MMPIVPWLCLWVKATAPASDAFFSFFSLNLNWRF